MANEIKNNLYLVNAPAGSGKTTTIKNRIRLLSEESDKSILCITYTNRAADELMKDIESDKIYISTIHSFLSAFMKRYFSMEEVVEMYFEVYGDAIKARIENAEKKEHIQESNNKYTEKYGELNYETIKSNLTNVYYNELSYNSLLYGGICHDDLISFSKKIIDKYPSIKTRIVKKFGYIYIDEYQDATAEVLFIFYNSVINTDSKLYLFGDKMQQIYNHYDGSFEEQLKEFDTTEKLSVNHRSTQEIVNVLNSIYNDDNFKQIKKDESKDIENDVLPRVFVCDDIEEKIKSEIVLNEKALQLFVFNKKRFQTIGAGALFSCVSNMKSYGFMGKYSASDILTNASSDNPDDLFKLLFVLKGLHNAYIDKKYGVVIQGIRSYKFFDLTLVDINTHQDKKNLSNKLEIIFNGFSKADDITLGDYLEKLVDTKLVKEKIIRKITDDEEYKSILDVPFVEFNNLIKYIGEPLVSTQHGVKGEGYDDVFFVSENSGNPSVKMYEFFNLWTKIELNFTELQKFYYEFKKDLDEIRTEFGSLNATRYKECKEELESKLYSNYDKYKENIYFQNIYGLYYDIYSRKLNVTSIKDCLNVNHIGGLLIAYKLFYVGCSRAKKKLIVFIDSSKVIGDKTALVSKLKKSGFEVDS